jgi:hypothetical protein
VSRRSGEGRGDDGAPRPNGRPWRLTSRRRRSAMPDLAFVLLTVALFGVLALVVKAVERL